LWQLKVIREELDHLLPSERHRLFVHFPNQIIQQGGDLTIVTKMSAGKLRRELTTCLSTQVGIALG